MTLPNTVNPAKVVQLREAAEALRKRISRGSYSEDELKQFWVFLESAPAILMVSSRALSVRGGLGQKYFIDSPRQRHPPRLENLLRALTAIIDVADEHLSHGGDRKAGAGIASVERIEARILSEAAELTAFASSLSRLARDEIVKLDAERPNDLAAIENLKKQRELLVVLAEGFEKISAAIGASARKGNDRPWLIKAANVVNNVGDQVNAWWAKNGGEAVDWSIRLPSFAAGVGMLGWAGANMTIATTAVAAIVGGSKVVDVIRGSKKLRRTP